MTKDHTQKLSYFLPPLPLTPCQTVLGIPRVSGPHLEDTLTRIQRP